MRAPSTISSRGLTALLPAAFLSLTLAGCRSAVTHAAASPAQPVHAAARQVAPDPPSLPPLPPDGVRGIHVTGWVAGLPHTFGKLVDMVDHTSLNAMVIDVRDDGLLGYKTDVPLAQACGAQKQPMFNVTRVMSILNKHHIFPIARIVCMRDTTLARYRPDLAVHTRSGKVWYDATHHAWLNPYKKAVWDYNVDIALDAIKHGFKEIQFDYVRFPSEGGLANMSFPGQPAGAKHEDQIAAFMKYAHDKIRAHGAWFAADVFGLTSLVKNDEGIGQKFQKVVKDVDYLCPMCYPSHYAYGEYGLPDPNKQPYRILTLSVGDAIKRLKKAHVPCKLRPWIQDFSLRGVHYGPDKVEAEIKALHDLGIKEFLCWNAACHYQSVAYGTKTPAGIAKM